MAKAKRRNEQMQYMFQHILLMQLHVLSTSFVIQDAAPHLKKGSSVVLIASLVAYNPPPTMAMYGVTKTAVLGLTKVSTWLALVP